MRHVDLVKNDWGLEQQIRVARVMVEQYPGSTSTFGEVALQSITDRYTNAVFFASDQHEDHECPFMNGNVLDMPSRTPEYVLSRIS